MLKKNQAPPPPQQKPDEKKNDEKKQEQQNKQNEEQPTEQTPKPHNGRINKDQADELLNALQREERKVRDKKEKQKGHPVSPEKDW